MVGFIERFMASGSGSGFAPSDDFWYGPVGTMSHAGERVDTESALAATGY